MVGLHVQTAFMLVNFKKEKIMATIELFPGVFCEITPINEIPDVSHQKRLMRRPEVEHVTGLMRSTIYD